MNRLKRYFGRMDDRLNPIVVRELRAATRGKMLPVMLIVYMGLLILMVSGILATGNNGFDSRMGLDMYRTLFAAFTFVGVILIPFSASARLTMERNMDNLDLLYITVMPPRRIIAGKFLAGMIISLLFLSATMPFLATSYLLRGISFEMIVLRSLTTMAVIAICLQGMLLLAVLPLTRGLKVLIGIGALIGLFTMFFGMVSVSAQPTGPIDWEDVFYLGLAAVAIVFLLSRLAILFIEPHSADRSFPVRLSFFVAILLTFVITLFNDSIINLYSMVTTLCLILGCAGIFFTISERVELGHRVRKNVPHNGGRALLRFIFTSGGVNGFFWSLSILGIGLIAGFMSGWHEELFVYLGLVFYSILYAMFGLLVYESFFQKKIKRGYAWLFGVASFLAATVLSTLILFLIQGNLEYNSNLLPVYLLSPLGMADVDNLGVFVFFSAVFAMVFIALNRSWFRNGMEQYKPQPLEDEA